MSNCRSIWCRAAPAVGLAVVLAAGCSAPVQQTDWSQRVGQYTYQQVVQELGMPVRADKQPDQFVVAQWSVTKRGRPVGFTTVPGTGPDAFVHGRFAPPTEEILILTFDPQGKLVDFRRQLR